MAQQRSFISAQSLRNNLQQFYEKPVTRVSLELFLSLTTVIFFALFALRPTLNTMSSLVREIEEKRVVDQELSKKIAALSTAQSDYYTYKSRFPVLATAVHQQLSLENALFYLEYLAAAADASLVGLQIKNFPVDLSTGQTPAAASDLALLNKSEIGIYSIQITFEGDLGSIQRFFRTIESVRPLLAVNGFSVTVREERNKEPVILVNATLFLYGYQPKQAPARAAGTKAKDSDTAIVGEEK